MSVTYTRLEGNAPDLVRVEHEQSEKDFATGGSDEYRSWREHDAEEKAAVQALCEAEQNHHVYSSAESALKDAILSLEVLLTRYSERFGDPSQLWRLTSPDYQYTKELFAPCLAALKSARASNEMAGAYTEIEVNTARDRCTTTDKKQAAELNKQAEAAVTFANKFLNWVSQFERTV